MRRIKAWIADRPRGELLAYAALIVLALAVRLIDLGDRPFHHDESQDAYFSWAFYTRGEYTYQPILHGPLRFYLTSLMYLVGGDSNFTARLAPALMGTLIVGLPYLLREQLGRAAALVTAALLAVGPTFLYFSRFAREDIYKACITLGLFAAIFRFLDRPGRWGPPVMGALLALSFATKESTFITGFVLFTFFVAWLLLDAVLGRTAAPRSLVKRVSAVGWVPWAYGFATFWLVFALLFTVFFTQPDGLWKGIHDGLAYWLEQHGVGRGGEPWYFYLAVLFGHEWPVLALGTVGAVAALLRPSPLRIFAIWAFVVSLIVYSWAGEKFAWLSMHPLLPLLLLAGLGAQTLWSARSKALRGGGVAAVAVCFAYVGFASYLANAEHRADPREFLVSTQSSEDVPGVVESIFGIDARVKRRTGRPASITVDSSEGATFPWAWYFRDLAVGYIDMTTPNYVPQTQVLLMTDRSRKALLPNLTAYEGRRFRFRVWWVRDRSQMLSPRAWARWLVHRETWNPIGGMPEWIYVRRDAEAA